MFFSTKWKSWGSNRERTIRTNVMAVPSAEFSRLGCELCCLIVIVAIMSAQCQCVLSFGNEVTLEQFYKCLRGSRKTPNTQMCLIFWWLAGFDDFSCILLCHAAIGFLRHFDVLEYKSTGLVIKLMMDESRCHGVLVYLNGTIVIIIVPFTPWQVKMSAVTQLHELVGLFSSNSVSH